MPPTCFFSAHVARLLESIIGTAYLFERQYIWHSIFRQASFCLLDPIAACISTMKQKSVKCSLRTHTDIVTVWRIN